jgi:hypothetical protein
MNDFSEIENELRRLRPARPSPVLFERIEEALSNCGEGALATPKHGESGSPRGQRRKHSALPHGWWSLGASLAAAAVLALFAIVTMERRQGNNTQQIAQVTPAPEPEAIQNGTRQSRPPHRFVPASATQVVYNERDEGLQFGDGLSRPLRRLRYQTHQTWQWRNPTTGASLRVSYPSEEVVLIPVSGQ